MGERELLLCTTHHSFLVGPWADKGVHVVHVDDPGWPVLLLRDRTEVESFVSALLDAVARAEQESAARPEVGGQRP